MKKILMLSFALFLAGAVLAQTKTGAKTASATKAPNDGSAKPKNVNSTLSDCYIDKVWKLTQVERFSVIKAPNDEQQKDMILLSKDGTFKMVINGVEKTGAWIRGSWLTLKPADGSASLPVKIESCEGSILKIDWRDEDVHNHFTYSL